MPSRRKKPTAPPEQSEPTSAAPPVATPTPDAPPVPDSQPAEHEVPRRQWQPDPFPLRKINLGAAKDGPTATLYRSNKLNQVAIRFDEKPGDEHRARLREAGWRWRCEEQVWTKQLDRERRAASQLEAERLFAEIGDAIREERGLTGRTGPGG